MTKQLTQAERMILVETNLHNLTKSVETGFSQTNKSIEKLNERLDLITPTLVTDERHKIDIQELRSEIEKINSKRWVQNTLSAILGSVLALLIAYFIQNIGR